MRALRPQRRWREVRGTISAVIVTLLDHRWLPIGPYRWRAPTGTVYEPSSFKDTAAFEKEFGHPKKGTFTAERYGALLASKWLRNKK